MRTLLVLLLLALPLRAVVYVVPDEAKSLFRRDLLPLDTDTMRELSSHITALARRDIAEDPVHWRATAQLLAIAVRLDPANRPARDLGQRLANREVRPPPGGIDFARAISSTWQIVDWLLQPEAGSEGQLLGHQLLDALHIVDPRHPLAKRHHPDGEAARWRGIVADLTRFQAAAPADPSAVPVPDPEAPPPPPPVPRPPIQLRQTSLITPLYLYDRNSRMSLHLATVTMEVVASDDPGPFSFALSPELRSPLIDTARERVRSSLERTWPELPLQETALLHTAAGLYASRNATAISGPASLLMHAALEGRQLRDDLVFMGDLKPDGALTRPRWSWDYLSALRSAEGGRLIVPPDLQPELRALIALESPEFFRKWEVLIVSSLDAALQVGTGEGPASLAEASRLFAEFQNLAKDNPIGPLCVNDHVRRRFEEILSRAPFHFSASMLLLQGNLERPTRVEREVAARILRRGVEPLALIARTPLATLDPARIEAAFDASRARLTPFAKYLQAEEEDLNKEALDLTNLARSLRRALQVGKPDPQGNLLSPNGVPVATIHQQFRDQFTAYLEKLAPYTGESTPDSGPADQPTSPPDQ